ncbi:MAG: hypothetical protein E4G90_10880 [Gemmatimonadales bacterium]|nr:MAG: hypothetical protein E4G90_10880 [Gemmatimonadales bacterium]
MDPKISLQRIVEGPGGVVPIEPNGLDPIGQGHAVDLLRLVEVGLPREFIGCPKPGRPGQLHHVVEGHLATDLIGEELKGFLGEGSFQALGALSLPRRGRGQEAEEKRAEAEKETGAERTHRATP